MEIHKTLICHLFISKNASCIMLFSVYVVTHGLSLILFLCPCEENRLWGKSLPLDAKTQYSKYCYN